MWIYNKIWLWVQHRKKKKKKSKNIFCRSCHQVQLNEAAYRGTSWVSLNTQYCVDKQTTLGMGADFQFMFVFVILPQLTFKKD